MIPLHRIIGRGGVLLAGALYLASGADFVLQDKIERPEPFAQSRLQINPPTFRWPQVEGAIAYRIELSQTGSFENARAETVADLF